MLVVGGGITGAGVALDAASRGLRTALVEAADFASGTSSRSSKLVHGGLRYVRQGDLRLVVEALAERRRLLGNAPHLVSLLPFLVPLFGRRGAIDRAVARAYGTALWVYDLAGGWRIGRRHRRVSRAQALAWMPTLDPEKLAAGFLYYDAQADDARLTLAIVRTAVVDFGAVAVNHAPVTAIRHDHAGRVSGALLADGTEVFARVVVNATGVWADEVRRLDDPGAVPRLRPAKGIHLTVPWERVRCQVAAVVPVPGDRRSLFVVPWGNRAYVGTTDTDYDGPLTEPHVDPEDVAYVLGGLNAWLRHPLGPEDVVGTWAGLRPLVRSGGSLRTADLSRRHTVERAPTGLITVTGGKLTTYRRMAADAVDAVCAVLGVRRRSRTAALRLRGARGGTTSQDRDAGGALGVDPGIADHLLHRYGDEAAAVGALLRERPELAAPLVPGLPYLRAEAVWAVRAEMATSLDDVLSRRTRALLLDDRATAAAAPEVAALLAPELGWDADTTRREAASLQAAVAERRAAAGLDGGYATSRMRARSAVSR